MNITQLANLNANLNIRRWRNQPVQKEPKKLLTDDELFFLEHSLSQKFDKVTFGTKIIIQSLTAKLANILGEKNLKELAEVMKDEID